MSIASFSLGDAPIAAQAGLPTSPGKKPPPKRTIVAVGDATQSPEPR